MILNDILMPVCGAERSIRIGLQATCVNFSVNAFSSNHIILWKLVRSYAVFVSRNVLENTLFIGYTTACQWFLLSRDDMRARRCFVSY